MADLNTKSSPFYDNTEEEYAKGYTGMLFNPGVSVQHRELTQIGELANKRINEVATNLLGNNKVIRGGTISDINLTTHKVQLPETKAIIDGYITVCPASTFDITGSGEENIYIELFQEIVTELEDGSLLDPAEGYDNYNNDGAYRKKTSSRYCLTPIGNKNIKLFTLNNGVVTWKLINPQNVTIPKKDSIDNEDILEMMKKRTFETSGNYIVGGFSYSNIGIGCRDDNKIGLFLTDGVAYVEGERVVTQNKNIYVPRKGIKNSIDNELKMSKRDLSHGYEYVLSNPNVEEIISVDIPRIIENQPIARGNTVNGSDELGVNIIEIVSVSAEQDGSDIYDPSSYILDGNNISWIPADGAEEPATGTTYYVSYVYNEPLDSSKYKMLIGKKEDINYWKPNLAAGTTTIGLGTGESSQDNYYVRNLYSGYHAVSTTVISFTNGVCDLGHNNIRYKTVVLTDNWSLKTENTDYVVNYETGIVALRYTPVQDHTIRISYGYFDYKYDKNIDYSVVRNYIFLSTEAGPAIPISVEKTSGAYDTLPSGTAYQAVRYYSKDNGYMLYRNTGINADYNIPSNSNQITWLSDKAPVNGDTYVVEYKTESDLTDDIVDNDIYVEYLVENDAEALDPSIAYSCVLLIDEDMAENKQIIVSYTYHSPRIDTITLDKTGKMLDEIGPSISKNYANMPVIPNTKISLGKIFLKPHSTSGEFIPSTNYRIRMSDIRQIYTDVESMKYNISLTDLEREAEAVAPSTDMRGVYTDNFDSLNKLDTGYAWLLANPTNDPEGGNYPLHIGIPVIGTGALSMNYTSAKVPLTVDPVKTTATLMNNDYYMAGVTTLSPNVKGYTPVVWQNQPLATKARSLAEGLTSCRFVPSLAIWPDSYMFTEEVTGVNKIVNNIIDNSIGVDMKTKVESDVISKADYSYYTVVGQAPGGNPKVSATVDIVQEKVVNVQKTQVTTTEYYKNISKTSVNLGSYITSVAPILTLPKIYITVRGSGFVPGQSMIECYFDGKKVKLDQTPNRFSVGFPPEGTLSSDKYSITCNDSGNFRAVFLIPDNCRYGIREVKIECPGGISVTKNFFGSGLKTTSQSTTLNTTLIDVESKTHTDIVTTQGRPWSKGPSFVCRSYCGTTPLCQTLYVNNPSLSNFTLSDIDYNSDVFVTGADIYFKYVFPDLTTEEVFFAGFMPLNDSGVPVSDPENLGPGKWTGDIYQEHNTIIYQETNTPHLINGIMSDPNKAQIPYHIGWENKPIYLMGGKGYGFIAGDINFETKIWVAELGTTQTYNDVTTGERVSVEPARGILLSSPNGQTWATFITEDMKHKIYIADFSTGSKVRKITDKTGTYYQTTVEFGETNTTTIDGFNSKKANFFIVNGEYSNSHDGSAWVDFYYAANNTGGNSNATWIPFKLEQKVEFATAVQYIKIKAVLTSKNKYNSPVVAPTFGITLGRYSNISYYVSRTATFGEFNKLSCYLDKIYNSETGSSIEIYYSVSKGQLWKLLNQDQLKTSNLLYIDSAKINQDESKARIYQWGYEDNIILSAPSIASVTPDDTGSLTSGSTYYYKVAILNHDMTETILSAAKNTGVLEANKKAKLIINVDPSASGFKVYRSTDNISYSAIYNSMAEGVIASLVGDVLTLASTPIAALSNLAPINLFPKTGRIKISNSFGHYRWYTYTAKNNVANTLSGLVAVDCGSYLSDTDYTPGIGDKAELFDFDIQSLESINGFNGGNGKIPIYYGKDEIDESGKAYWISEYKETGYCRFLFEDDGVRFEDTSGTSMNDLDKIPYIKANSIKFLIKMYNASETMINYSYAWMEARRFMATCTFNSDLLP